MLTDQDIQKLIKEFSAVFSTRQEIDSELIMLSQKVKTLEKWLHQIADKVGVQLEYL